ncbi:MAG: hypothetical protein AAGE01_19630 [Pseudomonadota bacterium]
MKWVILVAVLGLLGWFSWRKPRLSATIIWSLVATVLFTSALMLAFPGPVRERILWIALSSPLLWVAAMFWCYWDSRPRRPIATMLSVSLLSGIVIWMIPPPG